MISGLGREEVLGLIEGVFDYYSTFSSGLSDDKIILRSPLVAYGVSQPDLPLPQPEAQRLGSGQHKCQFPSQCQLTIGLLLGSAVPSCSLLHLTFLVSDIWEGRSSGFSWFSWKS